VKPRADADGFNAGPEIAARLYLGTFKRRMVAENLAEIRKSLGLAPEGDEEPSIVSNHGLRTVIAMSAVRNRSPQSSCSTEDRP